MQDVHWFAGLFGYFPTYTLGALIAAQLFATAREQVPEMETTIAQGEFAALLTWLRENVHSRGQFCRADELIRSVTGKPLGTRAFRDHLRARYLRD